MTEDEQTVLDRMEQEVADWHEALMYMRFSLAFAFCGLVAEIVAIINFSHTGKFFFLLALAWISMFIGGKFHRAAREITSKYRR